MDTDNFRIGAGQILIDDTDVGGTTEKGAVVKYDPDVHLHLSGKYGTTPVKATIIGRKLTVEIEFAETTKENMERVFAGSELSESKIKFGGAVGIALVGHVLKIVPFDETETWTFKNAVPIGSIDVAYQVSSERIYKATFQALIDTDSEEDENLADVS